MTTITNPAKEVMSQIIAACYNQNTSFNKVVKQAGYSPGTAYNDRKKPLKVPLERIINYMQVLKMDDITINSVIVKVEKQEE